MRVGEVTDTRQRNEVKEEKEGKTATVKSVFSVKTPFLATAGEFPRLILIFLNGNVSVETSIFIKKKNPVHSFA